jgi:Family of unknown function (DUF5681)
MTEPKKAKTVGRWKPGESGNPAGRAPGSGVVEKLRAQIADHIPAIIAKLVEQAKDGDASSSRLLLERVIPPLKAAEQAVPLVLPDGSLTDQGRALLSAAASGILAPGQLAQLLTGLGSLARVTEVDELSRRVAELEALTKGNQNGK